MKNPDIDVATIIDIDMDHDESKSDKIYSDFSSNEFGDSLVKQLVWGTYHIKPVSQEIFEINVRKAAKSVVADQKSDFRPRIKDLNTGMYYLIDTGACVSVFPKSQCPGAKLDQSKGLQAVNNTTIATYGTKIV